jgi:hypothetical protein
MQEIRIKLKDKTVGLLDDLIKRLEQTCPKESFTRAKVVELAIENYHACSREN